MGTWMIETDATNDHVDNKRRRTKRLLTFIGSNSKKYDLDNGKLFEKQDKSKGGLIEDDHEEEEDHLGNEEEDHQNEADIINGHEEADSGTQGIEKEPQMIVDDTQSNDNCHCGSCHCHITYVDIVMTLSLLLTGVCLCIQNRQHIFPLCKMGSNS